MVGSTIFIAFGWGKVIKSCEIGPFLSKNVDGYHGNVGCGDQRGVYYLEWAGFKGIFTYFATNTVKLQKRLAGINIFYRLQMRVLLEKH